MEIKPLRRDLVKYLAKHGLVKKFEKQSGLFIINFRHASLHTEILSPKSLKIYSFRLDRKFRVIFVMVDPQTAEIIDINDHYK